MSAGVLTQLRGEVADSLAGDLTVYDHVPARVQLPCAFIMAGSPYIDYGDTFGSSVVRFGVVLLTSPGLNSTETVELDRRIEDVQGRLLAEGWAIERVAQPQIQDLNGAEVLATEISVACLTTFPDPTT